MSLFFNKKTQASGDHWLARGLPCTVGPQENIPEYFPRTENCYHDTLPLQVYNIFFLYQMSFLLSSPTFSIVSSHCLYFNSPVLIKGASTLPLTGALPCMPHCPHHHFSPQGTRSDKSSSSPPGSTHLRACLSNAASDQSPMFQRHPSKAHWRVPALQNDLHSFWFYKKTNHVEYLRWDERRKMVSDSVPKSNQEREGTPARKDLTLPGDILDGRHCSRLTFFTQEIVNSGSELRAVLELWFLHCFLHTFYIPVIYTPKVYTHIHTHPWVHTCTHWYTYTHSTQAHPYRHTHTHTQRYTHTNP